MNIPTPSKRNPLVSMGPCPEILLEDRVIRFRQPYPRMAMTARGRPAIFVFSAPERPGAQPVERDVVRKFERFNNRRVRTLRLVDMELSGWQPLGKCKGEVYMSNKEGRGNSQEYLHEHSLPLPTCYINGPGNIWVIMGGKFNVTDWIEG